MIGKAPRGQNIAAGFSDKRPDIDVLLHLNPVTRWAGWQSPPFFPLDQHSRSASYEHRRDVALSAHCNIRRAPLEDNRTVRGRARTFRKNDQIAPTVNCFDTIFNELDAIIIIADIGCSTDRGMGERVAPKPALDDAVGPLDKSHEKHNIDERRMVGKNQ